MTVKATWQMKFTQVARILRDLAGKRTAVSHGPESIHMED